MPDKLILMGVVGRPHGVRGLLRVTAFTEDAARLADYPLADKTGRRFTLEWISESIAQLAEITPAGPRKIADRNAAEKLVNTELFAPRSALPATDAEEFYLADLIGLPAHDAAGAMLGTIAAVHDYGGGTSLEIFPGALLIPFTQAAVPVVDLAAGRVVVNRPVETTAVP